MRKLSELLELLPPDEILNQEKLNINDEVKGITHRLKDLCPGDVYICFEGMDLVLPRRVPVLSCKVVSHDAPVFVYNNLKEVYVKWLESIYSHIIEKMQFLAVTGTNGKSTMVDFLRQFLEGIDSALNPASLGTLGVELKGYKAESYNTTPYPIDLYRSIAKLFRTGCKIVCLEASSHGLEENRLQGIEFMASGFSNLSHEHLDYHKDMQSYFESKLKLISLTNGPIIYNLDCPFMKKIGDIDGLESLNYSLKNSEADIYIQIDKVKAEGFEVKLFVKNKSFPVKINFQGKFNLLNSLCAFAMLYSLGYDLDKLVTTLPLLKLPEGRFEKVKGIDERIYIDYAHSPDALEQVLGALKDHFKESKIKVVFGCGGDRDKDKRSEMGRIVSKYADAIVVTSDNDRTEDPELITEDILKGIGSHTLELEKILDREEAIRSAIEKYEENQVILLAGKGHERYQDKNGQKIIFDEREKCRKFSSKK